MLSHIQSYLTKSLSIKVDLNLVNQLRKMVLQFEIRDEHPMTLNSQMFGVNKFIFNNRDRQLFFDIIGYDESEVSRVINEIPSINKDFKVISDAFNIMSVYLAHLILNSSLQNSVKEASCIDILNYMQYRFIGSAVNHYFPHSANHDIMQTVVESLNMKFSIRQLGSWKAVVSERSKSLIYDTKVHHNTLKNFNNDKDILYLITDTSTRIRSQLKIITAEYYSVKETNTFITSHSSTAAVDGEKILREKDGAFENMSSAVASKVLIKSSFIDERYIKMTQSSVSRLNTSIIRRMLSSFSDEARHQMEIGENHKVIKRRDNTEIYVGIDTLIDHLIHVIYSSAVRNNRVNINSKIAIYTNTKNIFTAARTSNPELINVKASVAEFLKRNHVTSRESTISGLTIVLALYLTLVSFNTI